MASQVGILGLDTVFLVGKATNKIPATITKGCLTALSGIGLTALPYSADLLRKTIQDLLCGKRAGNATVMVISAFKVLEIASNLGLLTGGFTASLFGLFGDSKTQSGLYGLMIPWGETTLVLSLGLLFAYLVMTKRSLNLVDEDVLDDLKECNYLSSAAHVRMCMDKDTLGHLIKKLGEIPEDERYELLSVIRSNIETQAKYTQGAQLGLTLIGYLLMAVEKYFTPNSLQSAYINLSVASAYTIKMFVELLREVRQRHHITQLADQAEEMDAL